MLSLKARAATGYRSHAEQGLVALEAFLHVAGAQGIVKSGPAKTLGVTGNDASVVLAPQVLASAVFGATCDLFELGARYALRESGFAFLRRWAARTLTKGGAGANAE